MAPAAIAAALVIQKWQSEKAKKEAIQQQRLKMSANRANDLGYPSPWADVASGRADAEEAADKTPNYLGMLMDAEDKSKREGRGGELEGEDYLRMLG